MPWRYLRMEEHFELVKANFIRCEECNENFFFDFLRHPRYFVTHFKSCHLKNLLYRFNGYSEEENSRVRFGPRRKKDANNWFAQLKSTEKRMISMQDNKWSEISERECWSCRLCNDGKADLTQVFELSELGRGQAFLHLRQVHERAYEEFLHKLPAVQNGALVNLRGTAGELLLGAMPTSTSQPHPRARATQQPITGLVSSEVHALAHSHPGEPGTEAGHATDDGGGGGGVAADLAQNQSVHHTDAGNQEDNSARNLQQRMAEAERSRLRRLKASSAERQVEAMRSKKRRENLTPVQRQADYDRRKRKKKRQEESERSRKRREDASEESRQKELLRSRERRRNATEDQRKREAERSKRRRENASEEQRLKERERCRKRYETKKSRKGGSQYSSNNSSGNVSDDGSQSSMSASDYHHYHHRDQHNSNSSHHHQQQRHLYYQREQQQQQHLRYEGGHSHGAATTTQAQQQTTRIISSLPLAPTAAALSSGLGTGHVRQVPPIESIRVPPPPPPLQSMDDVRSSLSDSTGFRFFSPSPSAPTRSSISGGGGRPTAATNSFLSSGLPMYSQHLSTSPMIRSAGGVGNGNALLGSTIGTGGGGIGGNTYQPPASAQPQFALPQLPHSLQALSQSLQPLPSAGVTPTLNAGMGSSSALTKVSNLTSGARSAVASARSSGSQSTQSRNTSDERASGSGNNLAFV